MHIISRKDALELGLKRYFTGKPCRHGHVSERRVAEARCVVCDTEQKKKQNVEARRQRDREYHSRNKEKRAASYKGWKLKNLDKHIAYNKEWYKRNKPKIRARAKELRELNHSSYAARAREYRYGIPIAEQELILYKQGGVCAICKCVPTDKRNRGRRYLSLDHCHSNGIIRGFLCSECNTGIGQLNDDPELLTKAINYIIMHRSQEIMDI